MLRKSHFCSTNTIWSFQECRKIIFLRFVLSVCIFLSFCHHFKHSSRRMLPLCCCIISIDEEAVYAWILFLAKYWSTSFNEPLKEYQIFVQFLWFMAERRFGVFKSILTSFSIGIGIEVGGSNCWSRSKSCFENLEEMKSNFSSFYLQNPLKLKMCKTTFSQQAEQIDRRCILAMVVAQKFRTGLVMKRLWGFIPDWWRAFS